MWWGEARSAAKADIVRVAGPGARVSRPWFGAGIGYRDNGLPGIKMPGLGAADEGVGKRERGEVGFRR